MRQTRGRQAAFTVHAPLPIGTVGAGAPSHPTPTGTAAVLTRFATDGPRREVRIEDPAMATAATGKLTGASPVGVDGLPTAPPRLR